MGLLAAPASAQNSSPLAPSIFLTRAQIPQQRIPGAAFIATGFARAGDLGAGALYVRGSAKGLLAIQDGAGVWWNLSVPAGANVGHFGAAGDGVTDDTAAIQAAFSQQQNKEYKNIFFPGCSGGYLISSTIRLWGSHWSVRGESKFSSVLKTSTDVDILEIDTSVTGFNMVEIRDLGFRWTGSEAPAACTAIHVSSPIATYGKGGSNAQFRSLAFHGVYYGVRLCHARLTHWRGIDQIAAYGHFEFLDFHCPPDTPFRPHQVVCFDGGPGAHNIFRGGTWSASDACIKFGDGGANSGVGDQLIEGCHLIDAKYGVYIDGPSRPQIYNKNVTISTCQFDGISINTVYMRNMSDFRIVSNNSTTSVGFALPGCYAYKVENRFDDLSEYTLRERQIGRQDASIALFDIINHNSLESLSGGIYIEIFLEFLIPDAGVCGCTWSGYLFFFPTADKVVIEPSARSSVGSSAQLFSILISQYGSDRARVSVISHVTSQHTVMSGQVRVSGSNYVLNEI